MNRVWKPLSVGGLRLYQVRRQYLGEPHGGDDEQRFVVAANSPTHAAQLIHKIYADAGQTEKFLITGRAMNVYMPQDWWEDGVPCVICKAKESQQ